MRSNNDFYVYVIFRPNGVPCYVGKGKGQRAQHHAKYSHSRHLRNIYKQAGGTLPLIKVREGLTDSDACIIETAFIAAIGRKDLGTGPLVNLCAGGQGLAGHVKTPETRAKLSAANKGKIVSPETVAKWRSSKKTFARSPESIEKQKATVKGVPKPWISTLRKGKPAPWVREAQLGRKSPEHSARMLGNKLSAGKNTGESSKVPRKLTEQIIREIRMRAEKGEVHHLIAKDYGIHKSQISLIHNRRTWAWVD